MASHHRNDIIWEEKVGTIHACEGDRMVDQDSGTFLVWTLCKKDVPANYGQTGDHSDATCPECQEAIRQLGSR